MNVLKTLSKFVKFLKQKSLSFSTIIIGGAALNALTISNRVTKDIDCISPEIPPPIKKASVEFAISHPELSLDPSSWLNNGPISIKKDLGFNWDGTLVELYSGHSLKVFTLDRISLLKTKLFAYCDRDIDFNDCVALKPSLNELLECIEWVKERDSNEFWGQHVEQRFKDLRKALSYES